MQAALDAENPAGWTIDSRLLVTTSTGSVQLWEKSGLKWAREESLATTAIAELVEIPEKVTSELGNGPAEPFVARLIRHIADAQVFEVLRIILLQLTPVLEFPPIFIPLRQALRHWILRVRHRCCAAHIVFPIRGYLARCFWLPPDYRCCDGLWKSFWLGFEQWRDCVEQSAGTGLGRRDRWNDTAGEVVRSEDS